MADLEREESRPHFVGALVVAIAAVVFVAQNTADVTIHFLVFSHRSSVWVALLITGVLAIVSADLFARGLRRRRRKR